MKYIFFLFNALVCLKANCQQDYTVQLNDSIFEISLDKQYNFSIKGEKINLQIKQKDTLTYKNSLFSFSYPKEFKVSKNVIDASTEQISILTAEGSGLLIQSYKDMNPTTLNELMLTEMTKESISYGFESKRSNYKKVLKSGKIIEITRAELKYKDEVNNYEITSLGKKDSGIIIVTIRLDNDEKTQGQSIIDLMWASLIYY